MSHVVASFTIVSILVTGLGASATPPTAPPPAAESESTYRRCQKLLGGELPLFKGTLQDVWMLPVAIERMTSATLLLRWRGHRTPEQIRHKLGLAGDLNLQAARYVIPLTKSNVDGFYYTIVTGWTEELQREIKRLINVHGDRHIHYHVLRYEGEVVDVAPVPAPSLVHTIPTLAKGISADDRDLIAREGLVVYAPERAGVFFLIPNDVADRIPSHLLATLQAHRMILDEGFDLAAYVAGPPVVANVIRTPEFTLIGAGTFGSINRYAERHRAQLASKFSPEFERALDDAQADAYRWVRVAPSPQL